MSSPSAPPLPSSLPCAPSVSCSVVFLFSPSRRVLCRFSLVLCAVPVGCSCHNLRATAPDFQHLDYHGERLPRLYRASRAVAPGLWYRPLLSLAPVVTISPDRCARPPQPFTRNEQQGQAVPIAARHDLRANGCARPHRASRARLPQPCALAPCRVRTLPLRFPVRNPSPRPCAVLARPVRRHDLAATLHPENGNGQAAPGCPLSLFRLPRRVAAPGCPRSKCVPKIR